MCVPSNKYLYIAGGFEGDIEDTAWSVSSNSSPQPQPRYTSNAEETDTRLWLHVKNTTKERILIKSPDTDIYHIGVPLSHDQRKEIFIQINKYNSYELQYIHLQAFITALENDPDLSSLPQQLLPQTFQTIYVATGSDYTSFFSGIGKSSFLKTFYQHSRFISSGKVRNAPGTLVDVNPDSNESSNGFLAFLRLVGTAYFKKYPRSFSQDTPDGHFNFFWKDGQSPLEHHKLWLDDIRQQTWDRVLYENEMVPSMEALYRHWMRTCWVIHMWKQANKNIIELLPLTKHGWKLENDILTSDWDSEENIQNVNKRVAGLLKGCRCKTGCKTARCGCKKKGNVCSEGCECTDCTSNSSKTDDNVQDSPLDDVV